jgi:mannose-6-phosphate isomerase-like protein (cupin superfamily)
MSRPEALVVHADQAEQVGLPHGGAFHLLADAHHTAGAVGANRLTLGRGADGARPHFHALSTELFFVWAGSVDFLVRESALTTVAEGGLVVVPPGLGHAFGATPGHTADLISVLTPGVDRFDYFRALGRIQAGEESFDSLLPEQGRFDVHFLDPATWNTARTPRA